MSIESTAASVRVLIGTTAGPVEVLRLSKEAPIVRRSVVSLRGSTERAGIERGYQTFVAKATGVIERAFGDGPYRVDISAPIDAGSSWQLGMFAAHALHQANRLSRDHDAAGIILWTTGTLRNTDLTVGDVGHVPQKLTLSQDLLRAERARANRIIVALPDGNAADLDHGMRLALSELNVEVIELDGIGKLLRALDLPLLAWTADAADRQWQGSPYRSLEPFDIQHRDILFGRGRAREEALERLRTAALRGTAFLLVHGRSGSGKSSLIRAGLVGDVLALARETEAWRHAVTRPQQGGLAPIDSLAEALATALPELAEQGQTPERIAADLRREPAKCMADLMALLPIDQQGRRSKLLLVIDQLEELLDWAKEHTADSASAEMHVFGEAVAALSRSGAAWIIASLRSDRLAELEEAPALSRLAADDRLFRLERPSRGELREIVLQSAHAARLILDGADANGLPLADILIDAAARAPDSLPMLQVVLARMFEQDGASGRLTFTTYARLGGLEGAIARWADERIAALSVDDTQRLLIERLILDLGRFDAETGAIAARTSLLDTSTPVPRRNVIGALAEARLLTLDAAGTGTAVRVVHDTLLISWPWARGLFENRRREVELRDRLEQQAAAWIGQGRDSAFLLRSGRPLEEARELVATSAIDVPPDAQDYVAASIDAAELAESAARAALVIEASQARRRSRLAMGGGCVLFVLAAFALYQTSIARQESGRAEASAREANRHLEIAHRSESAAVRERDSARATESRYLARSADETRIAGDAVTGMLIALEALPVDIEKPERPHVFDAEAALSRAVYAQRERLIIVPGGRPREFRFDKGGGHVVISSREGGHEFWDVVTGRRSKVVSDYYISDDGTRSIASLSGRLRSIPKDSFLRLPKQAAGKRMLPRAISGDGQTIVAGFHYGDGSNWLWTDGGRKWRPLDWKGYSDSYTFSADNTRLAIWTSMGRLATFELPTGRRLATRDFKASYVNSVIFEPGGTRLIIDYTSHSSDDDEATVLSADTLKTLTSLTFGEPARKVDYVGRAATGELVAKDLSDYVLFHPETWIGRQVDGNSPPGERCFTSVLSPRRTAVARLCDRGVHLRRVENLSQTHITLVVPNAKPDTATWHPTGKGIAVSYDDGTVRMWWFHSAVLDKDLPIPSRELIGLEKGRGAMYASAVDGTISLRRVDTGEIIARIGGRGIGGSQDGRYAALLDEQHGLVIWDSQDRSPRVFAAAPSEVAPFTAATLDNAAERIATASSDGRLRVWQVATGRLVVEFEGVGDLEGLLLSPDGKRLAGIAKAGITIWDASSGNRIYQHYKAEKILFSNDGRVTAIYGGSADDVVLVDTTSGETRQIDNSSRVIVAVSPDGTFLALGSTTSSPDIVLVDAANGARRGTLIQAGHAPILHMEFDQTGARLLSVGSDDTARIWDVNSRTLIGTLDFRGEAIGARGAASMAMFSDDDRIVSVPVAPARPPRLWLAFPRTGDLVRHARRTVPRCLTPDQRREHLLPPEPPHWCIEGGKWPYHTEEWKTWLADTKSGRSPALPAAPAKSN